MVICLWMGKTNTVETPSSDFKVITPEIPLLSQQEITSKRIPVAYINLQLNPYPNTQLDLFYSDNFSFWCTAPSIWLTNCADPSTRLQSPTREGCWLQSSSVHPNGKDPKDAWSQNLNYGVKTQQLLQELRQTRFSVTLFFTLVELCSCATLHNLLRPLK